MLNKSFSLTKQGDGTWSSQAYDHLPTGASCTVTETARAGATTTQVQVTRAGVAGTKTTASATSFTLVEGDATVATAAFTNTYGIGSARITKSISGPTTWATADFTVLLSCTAPSFSSGTVYSQYFTFRQGDVMSALIQKLPTGASCTVTETATGGANATAYTNGTFTVGNGTTTAVTVTNTFRTGSVQVAKVLQVNGSPTTAQPWASGSYTMTLACTRQVNGAPETLAVPGATKTISGGGSATWSGLPQGASCTVTETGVAYPDGTPDQPVPTSTTYTAPVTVGNGTTVELKVTNDFAYGSLQVVKHLTGEAADKYASGTFSFAVACTLDGFDGTIFAREVSLSRSGTETTLRSPVIDSVPVGAVCAVTETGTAGATTVTPEEKRVTLHPITTDTVELATFANEFRFGGFTVTKFVDNGDAIDADGNPIEYAGAYAFTASCLFNGAEVLPVADRTFTLTRQPGGNWSAKAFSELPSGALCTVTETGTAKAASTSVRVSQGGSVLVDAYSVTTSGPFPLATGDATATTVAFANHYDNGGLDITKQTTGTGADRWGDGTFTLALACTLDHDADPATDPVSVYAASRQLSAGQTWSVRRVAAGANCTVTEPNSAGANATAISNGTPVIARGVQDVTVTNTFNTGAVAVTKALRVDGSATAAEPWASGTYTMTLACTKDFDEDGIAEPLAIDGPTRTITGAGTATWTGLPQGANCSVTETGVDYPDGTPNQPVPTATTYSGAVVVGNATTGAITVTNDFAYGNLQIAKTLAGPAAGQYASGTFRFDVACTLAGSPGTVYTRDGIALVRGGAETTLHSGTIGPIPQGAVCTVTETGTGGATRVSPEAQVVTLAPIVAGSSRTADFTNEFEFAGFTVTKTVDNGGAKDAAGAAIAYAGTYSFTASCMFNGNEVLPVADRSFTLAGGAAKAFTGLPSGASCTVTETGRAGAASTSVRVTQGESTLVDASAVSTGAFTLTQGDASTTQVGFINRYTTGGLNITKQTTGAGAGLWDGGTFTVSLACTLDHDANPGTAAVTVYNRNQPLRKGETWQVRDLPTGAKCTLGEPNAAGANSTSYTNRTPTITTANQAATVTNAFTVGSVRVTKALRANGLATAAEPWASGTYPVTLACTKDFDGDGTAETLSIADAARTITGAGSQTWHNLPQGANCTVVEGASSVTGQPQPSVSVGSVAVGASTAELTLTNDFAAAKLVIHKEVTGDGAVWGTGPFAFDVGCTLTGHAGQVFATSVTLTPAPGQTSLDSTPLGPIPVGSVCTVTETATGGATSVASPAPVTMALNAETADVTTVAFTNEFRNAGFTVTKTVDDGGAKDASGSPVRYRAATFTASCRFEGTEVLPPADRSFSLAAGSAKQYTALPAGADCVVTEVDAAGAAATTVAITQAGEAVADTDPDALAAGFELVSGDALATRVGFTNRHTTGKAVVTKVLAGAGAERWADAAFTVRTTCTLATAEATTVFDASRELSVGDPWTIEHLPTGADCTVTETAAGAANSTSISNRVFTVGTGTTEVGVTNTYTLGTVVVSKHLTVDGDSTSAEPWTAGSYTVELSCTRKVNGVDTPITVPGGSSRTITGAGTAGFTDLPTGATCSLAEVSSSPAAQQVVVSPLSVTIGADADHPQGFSVTNDFHTAGVTVRKQLAGAGADTFGSGPFDFEVACTLAGAGEVFSEAVRLVRPAGSNASALDSAVLGPVPVGAVCQITETGAGGADTTPDPVTLTIAEDDSANVATFTNRFSAGTVWLAKQLSGAAAGEDWATRAEFVIDVTCQVETGGELGTVYSRRVTLAGGERVNLTDAEGRPSRVPLGSHCFAAEVDAQSAGASTVSHDSYANAAMVTAGSPEALQDLELRVTNDYQYAGFTVTKAVDHGGAVDETGRPVRHHAEYGFQADCSLNGAAVLSQAFTLLDGATREFAGLPAGASCTVTETGTGAASATSVQATQNGTTGAAKPGTETEFTLQRGFLPLWADSPAHNRVGYTNSYDTGAVTITKQLAGAGADAWGGTEFTVRLACTADLDADPATPAETVHDASRTMSRAEPTWTVGHLPTGSSCTVTETASGGANSHSGPQTVVIGDLPAQVVVTNTFGAGTVRVAKQFTVDGDVPAPGWADQLAAGTFRVRLTCTRLVNGAAVDVPVPGGAERVLDAGGDWQATYSGLPEGADCTATEIEASVTPQGVTYSTARVTVATGEPVELVVTNDYRTGALVVAKQVTGPGAAFGDGPFGFDVSCTLAGLPAPVFTGEVELHAGSLTSAPLGPIPVGAACTVTETGSGGATTAAAPAVVTIPDDAEAANTVVATLTNDFQVGSFVVAKTVDDGGALDASGRPMAYVGRYEFTAACSFDGEALPLPDATFTLAGGESRTFSGLPRGATCEVVETGTAGAASTTVRLNGGSAVAATTVDLTVGEAPAEAEFTNHYRTGAATITKLVTGDGAAAWGGAGFTLHTTCTLDSDADPATPAATVFDATREVSRSAPTWELAALPSGADCLVRETATGGANTSAEDVSFTVGDDPGDPVDVVLTNEFTTGSVVVTKRILVDGEPSAAAPYAGAQYQVKLSCTRQVNGATVAVDVPGDAAGAGEADDGLRSITGAGSVTYAGLPTGADCVVAETWTSLALPSGQVSIDHPVLTVPAGEAASAVVSNDYHTGRLAITKALAGEGAAEYADAGFSFDIACELTDAFGVRHPVFSADEVALSRATSLTSEPLGPIPVGAECVVTERAAGGADAPALPATVTIADTDDNAVTLTNTFNTGALRVSLGLTLDGAPTTALPFAQGRYGLAVTCTREVNGDPVDVPVPGGEWLNIGAGERTITGLPVGADCRVTQTYASLLPQDVSFAPAAGAPVPVASGAVRITTDVSSPASLAVVDHFRTSTLTVQKVLAGAGAADHADHPFAFAVECTLAEDGVAAHEVYRTTLTLGREGGLLSAPLGPIPVGSRCVVTETESGGATVSAEPVTLTIGEDGSANLAELTNTFEVGTVVVAKHLLVDGEPGAGEPYASGEYTVELTCTQQVDGLTTAVVVPGGARRTIVGAGSTAYAGLPLGASCRVAEVATSLAIPADQVSISAAEVTVGPEGETVVVTNDYRTGTLVLRWQLRGVGTTFAGPAQFSVDCTLDGATGSVFRQDLTLTPVGGQTLVESEPLGPIPIGAMCTVTQYSAKGADTLAVPVTAGGTTATAVAGLANEYSAGTLEVTKVLTGDGAGAHRGTTFTVSVRCEREGESLFDDSVRITGAGSVDLLDATGEPLLLPAGTRCWAAETDTGGAQSSQVDHGSPASAVEVANGAPDQVQRLTITVTNRFAAAAQGLAWTGYSGGWTVPAVGLGFLVLGAWVVRRSRQRA